MRNSVLLSAAAHVVIVALALVAFPSPEELPSVQTRALPVELVTIDEVTNLKRLKKVEKPKPVEEPEPPKPVEKEKPKPEPKPQPAPTPPPPPEEKVEPIPDKAVEKKEPPKPVEKKVEKPKPPQKQPEPKKTFDPNQIAALLDKTPDSSSKPQPQQQSEQEFDTPVTDDPAAKLTMSEIDAFKVQMQRCWSVPAGAPEPIVVMIRVYLAQDGSLASPPELMDKTKLVTGGSYYRAAADSALRAIRLCQPFKMPADKYTSWREIELKFDPREMMGG
ncbi:cell envelope integrity protein TolA [Parvibaculum sp.]|uniref:cell envelope integrity protein TolA n=1 Tax=Parvibaculum sp. TaxID=2024848 RepID=UPI002724B606|nr:cell envelope integrity protein TolA [Parvibaculum sp.]MDO9126433.1 cell envelope integrity protein TolA [Parvibaculum sp.]MDP2151748.1 cell envelope integrity protein TolA [Parvibaculum sp.]MDP3328456.1 cell envelope integrity protein TolA [Parvibaculum sp.]